MNEAILCKHELILTIMEEMTIGTVDGRLTGMDIPLHTPGRQVPPLIIGADTVCLLRGLLVLP